MILFTSISLPLRTTLISRRHEIINPASGSIILIPGEDAGPLAVAAVLAAEVLLDAGEAARKRVFVCPEPSCLHHDPSHALGDLVGIKKHFRRKHSGQRQWACARCSKAYAVHSDYKAHLKTCGTRGHSCDCGRVFSR